MPDISSLKRGQKERRVDDGPICVCVVGGGTHAAIQTHLKNRNFFYLSQHFESDRVCTQLTRHFVKR